jgi:CelD/BcsL family acetyltransferase involved in cellulose biosynthesis
MHCTARLSKLEDIDARVWDRIAQTGTPTQQRCWIQACLDAWYDKDRVFLVVVERDGEVRALLPLANNPDSPQVSYLDAGIYEPIDLFFEDEAAAAVAVQALIDLKKPIRLNRLPAESAFTARLRLDLAAGDGAFEEASEGSCPLIVLDDSWADPESKLNAGRRSDLRRMRRNAEKLGDLTFEILSPSAEETQDLVTKAFAVEAASWKGEAGSAILNRPKREAFMRALARRGQEAGMLRLAFLHIGGEVAAMQYAFECGGGYWLFKIGYDDRFAKVSPGILLMSHTIAACAERGLKTYQFMGTNADWIQNWSNARSDRVRIKYYPKNLATAAVRAHEIRTHYSNQISLRFKKLLKRA